MNKVKFLCLVAAILVFVTGCGSGKVIESGSALPAEDGASEMTIEVVDYFDFYQNAAKKFEKETGVKVNVINDYATGDDIDTILGATDRITSELLAGKGADLFIGFYFDYNSIGKNHRLCNLADWIAQDPEFFADDYYMKILQSQMGANGMYAFPLFFNCNALGSKVEVPELDGKSFTWNEFFDALKDVNRSGVLYGESDLMLFMSRYRDASQSFVDESSKTQHMNSPEMINLMNECKSWSDQGLCMKSTESNQQEIYYNALLQIYGTDILGLTNIEANPDLYFYDIPSDALDDNKANKIAPTDIVCVNAASKAKATAWKFIKFVMTDDMLESSINMPVNRIAAEKNLAAFIAGIAEGYHLTIDVDKAIQDTSAALDSIGKISSVSYSPLEVIVITEAARFFKNEVSAEAAAQNMADKTELYFKEQ